MSESIVISIDERPDGFYTVCDIPDGTRYEDGPFPSRHLARIRGMDVLKVVKESMGKSIKQIHWQN